MRVAAELQRVRRALLIGYVVQGVEAQTVANVHLSM